jgi:hypothetical protein
MTPKKNKEIESQVKESLNQGMIRKSINPCAVPVVLAPKKGDKWRMCTDSREMNMITIRYRFHVPRIEDVMDYLGGARYFSQTGIKSDCYQRRMKDGDEWKSIFKNTKRLYE